MFCIGEEMFCMKEEKFKPSIIGLPFPRPTRRSFTLIQTHLDWGKSRQIAFFLKTSACVCPVCVCCCDRRSGSSDRRMFLYISTCVFACSKNILYRYCTLSMSLQRYYMDVHRDTLHTSRQIHTPLQNTHFVSSLSPYCACGLCVPTA